MRKIGNWVFGLFASVFFGIFTTKALGDPTSGPDLDFVIVGGALAGASAFICARLWIGERCDTD
jgi:hypothetical protein